MGDKIEKRQKKIKDKALLGMRRGWSKSGSARYAGVSYKQLLKWEANDKLFAAEIREALEEGTHGLEDIATSRAKRKSDTLMMFMLGARDPDKYRPKKDNQAGGNVNVTIRKF